MHTRTLSAKNKSILQSVADYLTYLYRLEILKREIRHERDQLAELSDHVLRDIGITREQAILESKRAFDDLPSRRFNRIL